MKELQIAVEQYISINAWDNDMIMDSSSFDTLMNVMINAGVIDEKSVFSDVVDNSLAEKLAQEIA